MTTEQVDVLIVGAGLSGIGAAWRLQQECPGRSYAILEAREFLGGTWDLFRYPGVRSDSDMYTLSYPFRPWRDEMSMADGGSILSYIKDTASDAGIDAHIHYGTKVVGAAWSSAEARWTVDAQVRGQDGRPERVRTSCSFLYLCCGYYNYDKAYQPDFPGIQDFEGRVVHPQFWPGDLDYSGKRVVVIGSGATAVTLVPAMADRASHVTMLQRSPSYVTPLPATDFVAGGLRGIVPDRVIHSIARNKNALLAVASYQLCRRRPELAKRLLRRGLLKHLDDPAIVDEHFTPAYQPWDQRLCIVPEGDLLDTINSGRASVVTDHVDSFVPNGIRLKSGEILEADLVVTATGLSLLPLGGVSFTVDGRPIDLGDQLVYRGLMLSGVPNLACCIGYTNASWTLRADLSSRYVCRLLGFMDRHGYATATPQPPAGVGRQPILSLTSGYVQRSIADFPKQGTNRPWNVRQNYLLDRATMARADVRRDMVFGRSPSEAVTRSDRTFDRAVR